MSTFNEVNSETLAQLARLRALIERIEGDAAREARPLCDTIAAAIGAAGATILRWDITVAALSLFALAFIVLLVWLARIDMSKPA